MKVKARIGFPSISLGVNFFLSNARHAAAGAAPGFGFRISAHPGVAMDQVVFFVLAHELRHASEKSRIEWTPTTSWQAQNFFAQATDPRLPEGTQRLLRAASEAYDSHQFSRKARVAASMNAAATRAHDVAVEMCADLHALLWMRKAKVWTPDFEAALKAERLAEEANNPPVGYQIGSEMTASMLALGSSDGISLACLARCVEILATEPSIDPAIAQLASDVIAEGGVRFSNTYNEVKRKIADVTGLPLRRPRPK